MPRNKKLSSHRHIHRAADRTRRNEESDSHPWNPRSLIRGHTLSDKTGLQRIGVHQLRIPPGKESFVFHTHSTEEEFLYVLSGRAVVELGDEEHELGPGDFIGFPVPSVGHHLRNPFSEDFVYLSGGERRQVEIADYPRLGRRMVRVGSDVQIHALDAAQPFPGSFGAVDDAPRGRPSGSGRKKGPTRSRRG